PYSSLTACTICTRQVSVRCSAQTSQAPVTQVSVLKNQLTPQRGVRAIKMATAGKPDRKPHPIAAVGEPRAWLRRTAPRMRRTNHQRTALNLNPDVFARSTQARYQPQARRSTPRVKARHV